MAQHQGGNLVASTDQICVIIESDSAHPLLDGSYEGALDLSDAANVEGDGHGRIRFDRSRWHISCPWHGWEFDVATGRKVSIWEPIPEGRACALLCAPDVVLNPAARESRFLFAGQRVLWGRAALLEEAADLSSAAMMRAEP